MATSAALLANDVDKPQVKTATIYVSTRGNDNAAGFVRGSPFATLAKAQAVARQLVADKSRPMSVEVLLAGGVYRLQQPLEITPDDTAGGNGVSYGAFPGEEVVLSGGEEIRGWKAVGNVWQTEVPDVKAGKWRFVDLYVGEERRPRARTPNEGYFRIEKAGDDKRTSFLFRPDDVKPWASADAAEVVFLHDWSTSRIRVKNIDEAARRLTFADPIGPNAPHYAIDGFERQPRYFLEGAREFLDKPGEWHLDTVSGVLSYRPLPGEKVESFVAVAPRLENLIAVCGTEGNRVTGISFHDLTLAHCSWLPPEHGFAGMQACFYEVREGERGKLERTNTAAAVKFDFVENANMFRCLIRHHGGAGIWMERDCRSCKIRGVVVDDIGGNGIMVGETISRPTDQSTQKNIVEISRVRRCGQRYFGAVGIWLGLVSKCKVEKCEVSDLPYTGISVGWKWSTEPTACSENTIASNHIHHCMQILSDGGGIYTLGRQPGTVISGNHIHDIPTNAGRAESNGMFLDEGSSEFSVEGNTIYYIAKSPIRFHQATGLTLKSNRLVSVPGIPTFRYNSADPKTMTFEKNAEITAEKYVLPADDPARKAGPGVLPSRER